MKVKWRLLARRIDTGYGDFVWAEYSSKKRAIALAKAFNDTHDEVKWEVYRQEGNTKQRVF